MAKSAEFIPPLVTAQAAGGRSVSEVGVLLKHVGAEVFCDVRGDTDGPEEGKLQLPLGRALGVLWGAGTFILDFLHGVLREGQHGDPCLEGTTCWSHWRWSSVGSQRHWMGAELQRRAAVFVFWKSAGCEALNEFEGC